MRKGIWQEFDGYQEIVEEIKVSRKLGGTVNTADLSAEEYIRRLHPDKLELCVSEIVAETPSTKTLRLVSGDHYLPPFQAGQYIALYPEIDGIRTSRPYSISSQPKQTGYYDITTTAPLAVGAVKKIIRRGTGVDLMTQLDMEANLNSILLRTGDFQEGITAMMERRQPEWKRK